MQNTNTPKPKVSIIVAVYKVADYIEQCARSLFEQTLDDLEIIFVDDATPDDSVAIIERTLQDYPNRQGQVKILHHEQNMDISQTRKDGLDAATGEYFIFVDGDDWVEPNYAELLYTKAKETGADIVICDYYHYYNEKDRVICQTAPQGEGENGERLRDDTMNRQIPPSMWIHLIRRSIVDENDIAWPVCGMAEDLVLITQISYYAKRLGHVDALLHHYRFNPNSYVNTKNEKAFVKRANDYMANLRIIEDFMKRKGIDKKYAQGLFISRVSALSKYKLLIDKPKYWWKYVSIYPSVSWALVFGNKYIKLKKRKRMKHLTIILGIYPIYMHIKNRKRKN